MRRRMGLLVPSTDIVMEYDLFTHLPADTSLHVARMYMQATTVLGEERMLDEELEPAAWRIASLKPELVIFGCTSAAALRGLSGDRLIAETVSRIAGCPSLTVFQAVLEDLRRITAKKLFVVTPYVPEVAQRLLYTLRQAGITVVGSANLGLDNDLAIGAVMPEEIKSFVSHSVHQADITPDSLLISCTTFRALEVAETLEDELGLPVCTSNRSTVKAIHAYINEAAHFVP